MGHWVWQPCQTHHKAPVVGKESFPKGIITRFLLPEGCYADKDPLLLIADLCPHLSGKHECYQREELSTPFCQARPLPIHILKSQDSSSKSILHLSWGWLVPWVFDSSICSLEFGPKRSRLLTSPVSTNSQLDQTCWTVSTNSQLDGTRWTEGKPGRSFHITPEQVPFPLGEPIRTRPCGVPRALATFRLLRKRKGGAPISSWLHSWAEGWRMWLQEPDSGKHLTRIKSKG